MRTATITTILSYVLMSIVLCTAKFFYIYEWPDFFSDVWPPQYAPLVNDTPYSHTFRSNYSGVGEILDPDIGYFSTWQFALYKLTMARLRVSEYRTMDPCKAMAFIIPFDMGVHSFIDHQNGRIRVASPHGWRAINYLQETIAKRPEVYWKLRGHDHFVVYSITSYQISGIGSKVFLTELCMNCSVITIETTPTFTARKYYSGKSKKWWYAVPYPSSFHWWEGIKSPPWIRNSVVDPARIYLSVFIGSVKTASAASNKLRVRLQKDCEDINSTCLWFNTAHSCSGMVNQSDNMLLYRKSIFCLAPPGDSLTRKSLFDSLLSGCIPVIFAKATINQYFWHISSEEVDLVSVYIPQQSVVEESVSFVHILQNISPERIKLMQDKIEEIAPRLQYSVVPMRYQIQQRVNQSTQVTADNKDQLLMQTSLSIPPLIWRPPVPDAVDVIISRILNRSTVKPLEGFTREDIARLSDIRDNALLQDPSYLGLLTESDKRDTAAAVGGKNNKFKRQKYTAFNA